MKVLYFHQYFTIPQIGGATRSYEFAKKLIERGHMVTMVCGGDVSKLNLPKTDRTRIRRGMIDGINVIQIDLPYSNNDSLLKRAITFIKFAYIGNKIAMQEEYDLLFATSTPLTAGIPGIWIKLFGKKKKFIFEVRDLWPELPKALGLKNPIFLVGMAVLEKLSYKKADACVGLSPGICEGIKRIVPDKTIEMIPNGCDLGIFNPKNRSSIKLEGISPQDTVAIFSGAHGVANGLDNVLDGAKEVLKTGRDDIKFVFIGSGKMKKHLMTRVNNENIDNCRFYNPMPKNKLNKIVASADIGIMALANVPAFYYGTSPNKFFDYISSGLSILNNYPGWLADMIKEYQCGEVVPPKNPKEFGNAVIKLADNPNLREMYGRNARKLAEQKFARNELANQFVDFLEKICKI